MENTYKVNNQSSKRRDTYKLYKESNNKRLNVETKPVGCNREVRPMFQHFHKVRQVQNKNICNVSKYGHTYQYTQFTYEEVSRREGNAKEINVIINKREIHYVNKVIGLDAHFREDNARSGAAKILTEDLDLMTSSGSATI